MEALVARIFQEVRPFTMVPIQGIAITVELVVEAIRADRPGDFVECGTWLGGSSFAMLLAQRYAFGSITRPVWMFDSFQGLPPAEERDGPMALAYQSNTEDRDYKENCRVSFNDVMQSAKNFGFTDDEAIIVPGWFNQTVPLVKDDIAARRVSVLRVDCDWYDPVRYVLDEFCDLIPDEGKILLDDYYAFDGCARATHDYLSSKDLSWRLRTAPNYQGAWMIKRPHRRDAI